MGARSYRLPYARRRGSAVCRSRRRCWKLDYFRRGAVATGRSSLSVATEDGRYILAEVIFEDIAEVVRPGRTLRETRGYSISHVGKRPGVQGAPAASSWLSNVSRSDAKEVRRPSSVANASAAQS